ncbi:MAG: ZIP family metal transporter [bacterium]
MLLTILLATLIVSLISFIGVVFFFKKTERGEFWLKNLISLAAGTLLATAFFHLLPEAIEESKFSSKTLLSIVLLSILFFFIIEKYLHWHHCRCEENESTNKKTYKYFVYTNLLGDAIHNFIDGAAIAASFLINPLTGFVTTLTIILHEIPQEISDFGILLYGGLERKKALAFNFLTALTAVLGALIFYYFGRDFSHITPLMIAFAAGNFIYLATADLIPEIHHEKDRGRILSNTLWLIFGVVMIVSLIIFLPHI